MSSTFGWKKKQRNVGTQDLDLDLQFQINGEATMMKFEGVMKMSWSDKLMKMFRRLSWIILKKKIKEKAQVLFGISQSQWKNSRIGDKYFREVFQAQHIFKVRI